MDVVVLRDIDSALMTIPTSARQPPSPASPGLPPVGEDLQYPTVKRSPWTVGVSSSSIMATDRSS